MFKLRIWYRNGTSKSITAEYDTITAARKSAYAKLKGKSPVKFVEIIEGHSVKGSVHYADMYSWTKTTQQKKVVYDLSGNLDDVGWYLNPDGTTAGQTPQYKRYGPKR